MLIKTILILVAFLSILMGISICLLSIIALVDPVGTQMANDNNPFGEPGGPLYPIILLIISGVLISWPIWVSICKTNKME